MKRINLSSLLLAGLLAAPLAACAQEKEKKDAKAKPYPMETCAVSGEKLGSGGMTTYTFVHEGQEVKLCCKSCLKDFKKDTAKYMAQIKEAADKKAKEKKK